MFTTCDNNNNYCVVFFFNLKFSDDITWVLYCFLERDKFAETRRKLENGRLNIGVNII